MYNLIFDADFSVYQSSISAGKDRLKNVNNC